MKIRVYENRSKTGIMLSRGDGHPWELSPEEAMKLQDDILKACQPYIDGTIDADANNQRATSLFG